MVIGFCAIRMKTVQYDSLDQRRTAPTSQQPGPEQSIWHKDSILHHPAPGKRLKAIQHNPMANSGHLSQLSPPTSQPLTSTSHLSPPTSLSGLDAGPSRPTPSPPLLLNPFTYVSTRAHDYEWYVSTLFRNVCADHTQFALMVPSKPIQALLAVKDLWQAR